jgi:hypothetical protein
MEALKALLESDAISEAMKTELEEAWNTKVQENKLAVTSELREEFAGKYAHDKSVMVEAIDALVSEKLTEEMAELHEDRKQLAEQKAKYAMKMREDANLMASFVKKTLVKEVSELHDDQKAMANKFGMLEEFVVEQLAIQETVAKALTSEIKQLKEDIDTARQNDFGRKIFEAFSNEYMGSHLNETSETKKLMSVVETKNQQIAEAKKLALKAKSIAEAKDAEVKRLVESQTRTSKMNELVGPLSKGQREIMTDLLESVQTNRLQTAFDKYLPAVIQGNTPAKQKAPLTEATEVTGNKTTNSSKADHNVIDIKRLAGL